MYEKHVAVGDMHEREQDLGLLRGGRGRAQERAQEVVVRARTGQRRFMTYAGVLS